MEIKKAEFIISAVSPRQYPNDEKTEIAFVGRSNVGKSSLLNTLTNRKKLARTSNTPGRTREINFFKINDEFYFVDLPGYGYAKISKKEKAKWGKIIEEYLSDRSQLKKIILLVDSRHVPTKDDVMMYNWIKHYNIPCIIVATKVDKISNNVLFKNKKIIRETLNIKEDDEFIPFSSLSKKGREEVLERL